MDKTCSSCKQTKTLDLFPPRRRTQDGKSNRCRACHRAYERDYYWRNLESERAIARVKNKLKGPVIERARNPMKRRAAKTLGNAIRLGNITKPDLCSECGWVGRIDGHHEDYLKPLEVIWLCRICHMKRHRKD